MTMGCLGPDEAPPNLVVTSRDNADSSGASGRGTGRDRRRGHRGGDPPFCKCCGFGKHYFSECALLNAAKAVDPALYAYLVPPPRSESRALGRIVCIACRLVGHSFADCPLLIAVAAAHPELVAPPAAPPHVAALVLDENEDVSYDSVDRLEGELRLASVVATPQPAAESVARSHAAYLASHAEYISAHEAYMSSHAAHLASLPAQQVCAWRGAVGATCDSLLRVGAISDCG
jgi:hypothetical protein